ncbi:MAG: hypothetical protein HS111_16425 [Kofleriaceae bacterium]|nr:hypothetical protein [Kofleriaceae bacterium]
MAVGFEGAAWRARGPAAGAVEAAIDALAPADTARPATKLLTAAPTFEAESASLAPWPTISRGSASELIMCIARQAMTAGCSTRLLMLSSTPDTVTMPSAIADSVPASGEATPAVRIVTSHITADTRPMMPAMTFMMLTTRSMNSEMAPRLLAITSHFDDPVPNAARLAAVAFQSRVARP